jgi:hypothetical protein
VLSTSSSPIVSKIDSIVSEDDSRISHDEANSVPFVQVKVEVVDSENGQIDIQLDISLYEKCEVVENLIPNNHDLAHPSENVHGSSKSARPPVHVDEQEVEHLDDEADEALIQDNLRVSHPSESSKASHSPFHAAEPVDGEDHTDDDKAYVSPSRSPKLSSIPMSPPISQPALMDDILPPVVVVSRATTAELIQQQLISTAAAAAAASSSSSSVASYSASSSTLPSGPKLSPRSLLLKAAADATAAAAKFVTTKPAYHQKLVASSSSAPLASDAPITTDGLPNPLAMSAAALASSKRLREQSKRLVSDAEYEVLGQDPEYRKQMNRQLKALLRSDQHDSTARESMLDRIEVGSDEDEDDDSANQGIHGADSDVIGMGSFDGSQLSSNHKLMVFDSDGQPQMMMKSRSKYLDDEYRDEDQMSYNSGDDEDADRRFRRSGFNAIRFADDEDDQEVDRNIEVDVDDDHDLDDAAAFYRQQQQHDDSQHHSSSSTSASKPGVSHHQAHNGAVHSDSEDDEQSDDDGIEPWMRAFSEAELDEMFDRLPELVLEDFEFDSIEKRDANGAIEVRCIAKRIHVLLLLHLTTSVHCPI